MNKASSKATIHFFVPYRNDRIDALPRSCDEYWPWVLRNRSVNEGKYSWTLQTYLQLRAEGFDCVLTEQLPDHGIVVAHRDFLPVFMPPRPNIFLVCVKPDRREHTWAHYYVVQNLRDAIFKSGKDSRRVSVLPFWPQPGLIPRNPARNATCRNIVYAGREGNLAPELRTAEWAARLQAAGFCWQRQPLERWHDLSETDVIVAARSFAANDSTNPIFDVDSKPPSKLINAWLAGVPAVLGVESAFRNVREHDLDYLEVKSSDDVVAALEKLRNNPELYRAMVLHGRVRAAHFTTQAIRAAWIRTLTDDIALEYESWRRRGILGRMGDGVVGMLKYFSKADNLRSLTTIFK
jgi:hypothetical protein